MGPRDLHGLDVVALEGGNWVWDQSGSETRRPRASQTTTTKEVTKDLQ